LGLTLLRGISGEPERTAHLIYPMIKSVILGILFLGLTLLRGISGSPDIPHDKVSSKNKMPNILYLLVVKITNIVSLGPVPKQTYRNISF
jgi:hypothetical protein